MKHKDYFKIVERITTGINLVRADCMLDYLFRSRPALHCGGGNYHIQKRCRTSGNVELGIIVDPCFHDGCVPGSDHLINNEPYLSITGFYRSVLVLDNSFIDPHPLGGYRSDFVVTFPNRTESEDNLLKLRAGKYYKDVCLLYNRLYQQIEKEYRHV